MRHVLLAVGAALLIAPICGDGSRDDPPARDLASSTTPTLIATIDPAQASRLESVLLTPDNFGPGWRDAQDLMVEAGYTPEDPAIYARTQIELDPGIESPYASCGITRAVSLPDGVKVATTERSYLSASEGNSGGTFPNDSDPADDGGQPTDNDDGDGVLDPATTDFMGGFASTAAALFPSEENAIARFEAYKTAMRGCAKELGLGVEDDESALPFGLTTSIESEELDLGDDAFGLRTSASTAGFTEYGSVDIVIRRGRTITALSVTPFVGFGTQGQLDFNQLANLMVQRLEAFVSQLPPQHDVIPAWSPDAGAQAVADSAILDETAYPRDWDTQPTPTPAPLQDDSVFSSIDIGGGSRMFIISESTACSATRLLPMPGMLARAGGMKKVGYDHYVWHFSAVYQDEDTGRAEAQRISDQEQVCDDQEEAARAPETDIDWAPFEVTGLERGDIIEAGISTWHFPAHGDDGLFPAHDVISTGASAVIRRGRMVVTFQITLPGEDKEGVEQALRLVVDALEAAADELD